MPGKQHTLLSSQFVNLGAGAHLLRNEFTACLQSAEISRYAPSKYGAFTGTSLICTGYRCEEIIKREIPDILYSGLCVMWKSSTAELLELGWM